MSNETDKQGYIYIYPIIFGDLKDFCKIGKTTHFGDSMDRIRQHVRTPYHGFNCFLSFPSYKAIVTAIRVRDVDISDYLVKEHFKKYQIFKNKLEVYHINYNIAIQELYDLLNEKGQFIELVEDGVTDYSFLKLEEDIKIDTSKKVFEALRDKILLKYKNKKTLPDDLISVLRDKDEFKECCPSHRSFIDFRDNLILDLSISKPSKVLLLDKLKEFTK